MTTLPISNLTAVERDILQILPTVKAKWGMAIQIGLEMTTREGFTMQPNNVQFYLTRLVQSGHVRKVSRGIYEVIQ